MTGSDTTTTPQRSVAHASFSLERDLPVPPARVFAAFAEPEAKAAWFGGGEGWEMTETTFDFRVGGVEVNEGVLHGETRSRFEGVYTDIVANERIVLTYNMWVDGRHISTSAASFEFVPTDQGTRLVHTEHGIHLDGFDDGSMREEGYRGIHDQLAAYLVR